METKKKAICLYCTWLEDQKRYTVGWQTSDPFDKLPAHVKLACALLDAARVPGEPITVLRGVGDASWKGNKRFNFYYIDKDFKEGE